MAQVIEQNLAGVPADLPRHVAELVEHLQAALVYGQSMASAVVDASEAAALEHGLAGLISEARRAAEALIVLDARIGLLARAFVANTADFAADRLSAPAISTGGATAHSSLR